MYTNSPLHNCLQRYATIFFILYFLLIIRHSKLITEEPPPSFSKIGSVLRPSDEIASEFPKFLHACALIADIHEGEMLYLPAGWFHEVHSFSSTHNNINKKRKSSEGIQFLVGF